MTYVGCLNRCNHEKRVLIGTLDQTWASRVFDPDMRTSLLMAGGRTHLYVFGSSVTMEMRSTRAWSTNTFFASCSAYISSACLAQHNGILSNVKPNSCQGPLLICRQFRTQCFRRSVCNFIVSKHQLNLGVRANRRPFAGINLNRVQF